MLIGDHGPDSAMPDVDCRPTFEGFDVEDAEEAVISGGNQEVADERQLDDPLGVAVESLKEVFAQSAVERVMDAENVDFVAPVFADEKFAVFVVKFAIYQMLKDLIVLFN